MRGKYHPPEKAPSETRRRSEKGEKVSAQQEENITVQVKHILPLLYVHIYSQLASLRPAIGNSEGSFVWPPHG